MASNSFPGSYIVVGTGRKYINDNINNISYESFSLPCSMESVHTKDIDSNLVAFYCFNNY